MLIESFASITPDGDVLGLCGTKIMYNFAGAQCTLHQNGYYRQNKGVRSGYPLLLRLMAKNIIFITERG